MLEFEKFHSVLEFILIKNIVMKAIYSSFSAKPKEINKKWLLIDSTNLVLGRLAAEISKLVRGKYKPYYTPHIDCGDNIIVINAKKIYLSGKKLNKEGKIYHRHTGFPGGIKSTSAIQILSSAYPERVLKMSIKRMLPKNKLGRQLFKNIYIYPGETHPHSAQSAVKYDFAKKNTKNYKS